MQMWVLLICSSSLTLLFLPVIPFYPIFYTLFYLLLFSPDFLLTVSL